MAQLVISAAGAAIGFAIGGPAGAKIGWVAGSMIGSTFAPTQKSQGPRLEDLTVSTSSYGTPIPYLAGSPRIAGQIIWASAKREIATTESAGKGGGGGSEYTTFTYEVDLLYLLSDNEIGGITRIWNNGELVYTELDTATDDSFNASVQTPLWNRITVYSGSAGQLPDPDYEAVVGTANAPAYRGRGSVFIKSLQLGGSGQIPNLTFEVYISGSADVIRTFAEDDIGVTIAKPVILGFGDSVRVGSLLNTTVDVFDLSAVHTGTEGRTVTDIYPGPVGGTPTSYPVGMINGQPVRAQNLIDAIGTGYSKLPIGVYNAQGSAIANDGLDALLPAGEFVGGVSLSEDAYAIVFTSQTPAVYGNSTVNKWYMLDCSGAPVLIDQGTVDPPVAIYTFGFGNVATFHFGASALNIEHDQVWIAYGAGFMSLFVYQIDAGKNISLIKELKTTEGILGAPPTYPSILLTARSAVVVSGLAMTFWAWKTTIDSVAIRDEVEQICLNSGLSVAQFDASLLGAITRPVRAMTISQVSSSRTVLEMLAAAYHFDCVLSDKLYFRPRGTAPVSTLTFDELGVAMDSSSNADPLPLMMANELEIPAQIALTYANVDGDYQTDTQYSDRLLTGMESTSATSMPLGFTASEGKQIADAILMDKAVSALSTTVGVGITRAKLEPTDVLILTGDDGSTYRMRVTKKSESSGVITLGCVADDSTVFTQAGVTDGGTTGQTAVFPTPSTTLHLLDIPLLRDADNVPGHYVAVKGSASNWTSCALFESADDVTYTQHSVISGSAVMGQCTTILGAWAGGNFADETNTLTVSIGTGQLSSVTHEQMLSNQATNAALVGNELIQFREAELISTGVYKLRGLLRGKRGTEWSTGTHATSERFVLAGTTGLRFIAQQTSDIGKLIYYRAPAAGQKLSAVTAQSMTLQSNVLKPLAPVNVRATLADGGATISWDRRTRLSENWLTGTVPLGEASESYDVEVFDGSDVLVDSATVTEPSYSFNSHFVLINSNPDTGILFMQKIGSDYFGPMAQTQTTIQKQLKRLSATGVLLESSVDVGHGVLSAAYAGSVVYLAAYDLLGGFVDKSKILRLTTSPITLTTTFTASAIGPEVSSLAHDGTYLWAAYQTSGAIVKLDGTSLAVIATTPIPRPRFITFSGGYLYILCPYDNLLIKWNCATNAEVWRFSTPPSPDDVLESNGMLVLLSASSLTIYESSTGAYRSTVPVTVSSFQSSFARNIYAFGGEVIVQCSSLVADLGWTKTYKGVVVFVDATTGALNNVIDFSDANISGVDGNTIIGAHPTGEAQDDFASYEVTNGFAGGRIKVYQKSETLGRGYPVEVVL